MGTSSSRTASVNTLSVEHPIVTAEYEKEVLNYLADRSEASLGIKVKKHKV